MNQASKSGRLFQDDRFEVTHLHGCSIEEIIGVIAYEHDLQPALILLKPVGLPCQRFFLSDGIGFWEQWLDQDIAQHCVDDSYRYVDYAEQFKLRGSQIDSITCVPVSEASFGARIFVRLSVGVLVLSPVDLRDFDSASVVSFSPC